MNREIHRLDARVPDPVESRRGGAGRVVRFIYAALVFGVLGFFIISFGLPLIFLTGPGVVSAPRTVISPPYNEKERPYFCNAFDGVPGTARPHSKRATTRSTMAGVS